MKRIVLVFREVWLPINLTNQRTIALFLLSIQKILKIKPFKMHLCKTVILTLLLYPISTFLIILNFNLIGLFAIYVIKSAYTVKKSKTNVRNHVEL